MARTPTLDGNERIKLFFPSNAFNRQASWLYSQMRFSPPASLTNSTIRSKSLRDALRAGEKTTTSNPKASERHAQKIAMLKVFCAACGTAREPRMVHTAREGSRRAPRSALAC